jgi:putative ABC transport system permease protein
MNESAVSSLGIQKPEQALGKQLITWRDSISQVVGIIKNHHQLSLRHGQSPTVYFLRPAGGNFYSVKVNPQQISQTIAAIKDDFETFFPGNPFDYFFLDEYFNRQYLADQRFGQIFGIFSGLAILIAALGLFALASNIVMQRTKEIGIRKVLGASLPNLLILLSKDFLLMILIATGIALPFAVVGVKEWLQNYAYRMEIGWDLFVLPPLLVINLALLIVCYQAFKAAITNLVDSLRYE